MTDPLKKPIKLLVTHQNPDLDAITACWLLIKFQEEKLFGAQLYFVPAGEEMSDEEIHGKEVERDEVVHVDTGMGVFDHHQPDNTERDSATLRVHRYLMNKQPELKQDEALARLVNIVNEIDHFASCYWPEAVADRYEFMLEEIVKGLRGGRQFNDREMVEFGQVCLDAVYVSLRIKVSAETDIKTLGSDFETKWGKALAIENSNDEAVKLAQKLGYRLVVRKDKDKGHVRIKAVPDKGIDLTEVYERIKARDQAGTWFLHPSKTMLLNGSSRNDKHVPTPLSLEDVVEIVKG